MSKHKLTKTKIFYNLENDDSKALKYTYIQKREQERGKWNGVKSAEKRNQ